MECNQEILNFLRSEDPLTDGAIQYLINYKEEDDLVDYKLTLDPASEKEWVEIVKDISALANTFGGYLVFGVKDSDKSIIGLDDAHASNLCDVNNIRQKINRFLEPHIEHIRSKPYEDDGKKLVILFVPESEGLTP